MLFHVLFLQIEFALNMEELLFKVGTLFRCKLCKNEINISDEKPSYWQMICSYETSNNFDKDSEDTTGNPQVKVGIYHWYSVFDIIYDC